MRWLLSNPDARAFLHFAENSQDGGIHADLIYDRPYDYSSAPEIVTIDRNAKYEFSTLERGVPQGYPLREQQEDKMQYLQVYFLWFFILPTQLFILFQLTQHILHMCMVKIALWGLCDTEYLILLKYFVRLAIPIWPLFCIFLFTVELNAFSIYTLLD